MRTYDKQSYCALVQRVIFLLLVIEQALKKKNNAVCFRDSCVFCPVAEPVRLLWKQGFLLKWYLYDYVCAIKDMLNATWKPIQNNNLYGEFSSGNVQERWKMAMPVNGCLSESIYKQEFKNKEKDKQIYDVWQRWSAFGFKLWLDDANISSTAKIGFSFVQLTHYDKCVVYFAESFLHSFYNTRTQNPTSAVPVVPCDLSLWHVSWGRPDHGHQERCQYSNLRWHQSL